jgi:hypothetical protein
MNDPGVQHPQDLFLLLMLLQEVDEQYEARNFNADQDAILYSAPQMPTGVIHFLYPPLGGGEEKNSVCHSLQKPCEQIGIIYHAMAVLECSTARCCW